jgi:hypothetical protein
VRTPDRCASFACERKRSGASVAAFRKGHLD